MERTCGAGNADAPRGRQIGREFPPPGASIASGSGGWLNMLPNGGIFIGGATRLSAHRFVPSGAASRGPLRKRTAAPARLEAKRRRPPSPFPARAGVLVIFLVRHFLIRPLSA